MTDTATTSAEPADLGQTLSAPADPPGAVADGAAPWLAVNAFDGPLGLLLALARAQQIDLAWLSIAALIGAFADALQAALRGVNAVVVGLLLAALYTPVWTSAINGPPDFGIGLFAFLALMVWKVPPCWWSSWGQ